MYPLLVDTLDPLCDPASPMFYVWETLTSSLPVQPLSLEELLKKRKAEQEDLAKVMTHKEAK